MKERIKAALHNFTLSTKPSGIPRAQFLRSAWENTDNDNVSIPYVLHRTVFFLYFLSACIHSVIIKEEKDIYCLYATRWSLWIQGFWGMLYAGRLYYRLYKERTKRLQPVNDIHMEAALPTENDLLETKVHQMHWIDSVIWVILSVCQTAPYTVSIGFWALIYDPQTDEWSIFIHLLTHGFNAILALVDLFVMAIPIHITHFLYAVSFFVVYEAFSGIYEIAGGPYAKPENPYIYSYLNWREDPGTAWKFSLLSIVWVFILYTGIWLLYRLRSILVVICQQLMKKIASTIASENSTD